LEVAVHAPNGCGTEPAALGNWMRERIVRADFLVPIRVSKFHAYLWHRKPLRSITTGLWFPITRALAQNPAESREMIGRSRRPGIKAAETD
jgi:hypothetical protein